MQKFDRNRKKITLPKPRTQGCAPARDAPYVQHIPCHVFQQMIVSYRSSSARPDRPVPAPDRPTSADNYSNSRVAYGLNDKRIFAGWLRDSSDIFRMDTFQTSDMLVPIAARGELGGLFPLQISRSMFLIRVASTGAWES